MRYWPTVRSRWLGTGRVLFFARRSRGPWSRKWRTKLIYSHLDQTGPVNKGFITTHKDFASTRILNDMFIFERLQRKPTVMACACLCFLCFDCLLTLLVIPFPALSRNYELWKSAPCIFPTGATSYMIIGNISPKRVFASINCMPPSKVA